jgi:hypothetical protein
VVCHPCHDAIHDEQPTAKTAYIIGQPRASKGAPRGVTCQWDGTTPLPAAWDHFAGPPSRPRKIVTEAVDAVKHGLSTRVGEEVVHRLSGTARDGLVGLGG